MGGRGRGGDFGGHDGDFGGREGDFGGRGVELVGRGRGYGGRGPPRMCQFFNLPGGCRKGDSCAFAHVPLPPVRLPQNLELNSFQSH